jgi:uridine kinase
MKIASTAPGMDRQELLRFLVHAILSRRTDGKPLKVAIDGRCAAGKSVLADELGALISSEGFQVMRLSIDEYHHPQDRRYRQGEYSAQGYYEDAYDYEAVVETVLKPLVNAGSDAVLVFDGIFLFRPELDRYWDFRILLDVDRATSLSRAIARDTGIIGTADVTRHKYEVRYEPAWQIYWNAERPESNADVIVDNRDVYHPKMLSRSEARSLE